MRCRVNVFGTQTIIQVTWLPSCCLAKDGCSNSYIIRLLGGMPQYGHEARGTRTREWLRWRGPAAFVNDREGAPQQKTVTA
jgi:hypothetical protein